MKSMLLALVGVALIATAGRAAELIPWFTDFRQACELAAEQRRLVLLHFYNDNCEPCRRLDQHVFSQPQVAQAITQSYVPVKVHAGRNPTLATRYQVQRWPTDVVVTPSGLEIFRTISPQKPAEYVALMQHVAQQAGVHTFRGVPGPEPPRTANSPEAGVLAPGSFSVAQTNLADTPITKGPATPDSSWNASGQSNLPGSEMNTSRYAPGFSPDPSTAASGNAALGTPVWQTTVAQAAATRRSAFLLPEESPAQSTASSATPAPRWAGSSGGPLANRTSEETANAGSLGSKPFSSDNLAPYTPSAAPVTAPPTASPSATPSVGVAAGRPTIHPWPGQPAQMARRVENPWVPRGTLSRDSAPATPPVAAAGATFQPPTPGATAWEGPPASTAARSSSALNLVPASQAPPVALDGFCPVTLVEIVAQDPTDRRAWKKGDPRFGAIHEGRTYLFASAEQQQKFLANPQAYAPVLGGYDPVHLVDRGVWVEGKRAYGLITPDQRIYLFADEDSLARFHQAPQRYAVPAVQPASATLGNQSLYR